MGIFQQRAASGGQGEGFEKAPPGNHMARLVAIVDMGTQKEEYGGVEKDKGKAYFIWELVTEKVSGTKDRNHLIGIALTLSRDGKLNEKSKLRLWIEARAGKKMADGTGYDILKELGQPCLLNVVHNEKGYPKIEGLSALPKGMSCPPAQHQGFSWSLEDFEKEGDIELPEWVTGVWLFGEPITEHIMRSKEIKAALASAHKKKDEEAVFSTADANQQNADPDPF